jgi:hypothetical protein
MDERIAEYFVYVIGYEIASRVKEYSRCKALITENNRMGKRPGAGIGQGTMLETKREGTDR